MQRELSHSLAISDLSDGQPHARISQHRWTYHDSLLDPMKLLLSIGRTWPACSENSRTAWRYLSFSWPEYRQWMRADTRELPRHSISTEYPPRAHSPRMEPCGHAEGRAGSSSISGPCDCRSISASAAVPAVFPSMAKMFCEAPATPAAEKVSKLSSAAFAINSIR